MSGSGGVGALLPLLLVILVGACSLWVLHDARSRAQRGRPVTAVLGRWRIDEPEVWAIASLIVWIVFFPWYLSARSQT